MRTFVIVVLVGLLGVVPGMFHVLRADEEPEPAAGPLVDLPLPAALRPGARGRGTVGAVEAWSDWTATHQCRDGHWSAADFDLWSNGLEIDRASRLEGRGEARHDVTVTSMAICTYLGAGWTHRGRHRYADVVERGLRWLKGQQQEDGRIGAAGDVRAHAWATLALTEAYGMTGSFLWYAPAKRALAHLMTLQAENGAWPRAGEAREDDALGTFMAAHCLRSLELIEEDIERRGRPPVFEFDPDLLRRTRDRFRGWLDAHLDSRTGRMAAAAGAGTHPEEHPLLLTAAGLLARIHLGADPRKDPVVRAGAAYLAKHPPTWDEVGPTSDLAYVWFGTLAMYQVGGVNWKFWNEHIKTQIVDNQRRDGAVSEVRGSWDPRGPWARALGRVGSTALATLCLEVYYRYDKVFGAPRGNGGRTLVRTGAWRRSALPPHAAQFKDRDGSILPIESARVAAEIHGVRARVVLDLWLRNPSHRQREGRLKLRLPDGAAPYYLAFGESTWEHAAPFEPVAAAATNLTALRTHQSGEWGAVREARMAPTAAARETYDRIVRQRRDPALLTWAGGGVFDLGVFPLVPGRLHRVVLGYEVDLIPVGEEFQLDLHLPSDVPDVSAVLTIRGASSRTVPEAPVVDGLRQWTRPFRRDIRVLVRTDAPVVLVGPDAAGREHFAAWIQPDIGEATRTDTNARAVFLLDTSASGQDGHFEIRRRLLESILAENRDTLKEFALAFFHTDVAWWRGGFVPNTEANREALRGTLEGLDLGGATNMRRALAAAASIPGPVDVFLLSDGTPTWGVADAWRLLHELDGAEGRTPERRVFAYRTGLEGEAVPVLNLLASWGGGALIDVLGESDVRPAATAHRDGVWQLKGLELPGVTDLFAVGRPRGVYRGQRLRLVGRGRPEAGAELIVHLERGPHSRSLRLLLPPAIPSGMAARAYGHAAVVELEALGKDGRGQALSYASHFRVVRDVAALVMLETEEDYAPLGLDPAGHASRVAAEPVGSVLAASVRRRLPLRLATGRSPGLPGLLHDVARSRPAGFELPPLLLEALAGVPVERLALRGDFGREAGSRPPSRAVGSRLESKPASLDALLAAAFDAWDAGHRRLAYVALCGGVVRHPRSRLLQWQLARLAQDLGLDDQALVWFELALAWRARGDLVDIVANDYARFLRHVLTGRRPVALHDFAVLRARSLESLDLVGEADRVVLVVGSAPSPDLELGIRAPGGRWRYRTYDAGPDDAFYVGTTLEGFGPKMFVAPRAPGKACEIVIVPRPGARRASRAPVQVQVVLVRDWGRASERTVVRRLCVGKESEPIRIEPSSR